MKMDTDDEMNPEHRDISIAAQKVCEMLASMDYLENNFRVMLARELRKSQQSHEVYEEVVIPYILETVPFGHGYADIVIMTKEGAIILELKTTKKDCKRQLDKYMKHWKYSKVKNGVTINFVNDSVTAQFYTPR
tara:strand:+ start:1043 stop:1444 length:402 start_codon:yes stop_codon:yes gene_type:complete